MPYVSRVLGAEGVGSVNYATNYASIFVVVAVLGLPIYGIREIAKYHNRLRQRDKIFSELFAINLLSTFATSVVYVASVLLIPALYQDRAMLLLAGGLLYMSAFTVDWFFSGMSNFRLITLRSVLLRGIGIIVMFVVVKDRSDAIVYLLITVLTTVATSLWNMSYLMRTGVKISFRRLNIKRHLKPLMIIFSTQISVMIYTQVDVQILRFLSDYVQVGFYTSVVIVVKRVMGVVNSVGTATIPALSAHVKEHDEQKVKSIIDKSFSFLSFLAAPLAVGSIVVASHFVPLFFGEEFMGAIPLLQIMGGLFIVYSMSAIAAFQILIPYGQETKFLITTIIGCVMNVALDFILIPYWQGVGAMIATAFTEIVVTTLSIYFVYRYTPLRFKWEVLGKNLLVCVPFVIFHLIVSRITGSNAVYLSVMLPLCAVYYLGMQLTLRNEAVKELKCYFKR